MPQPGWPVVIVMGSTARGVLPTRHGPILAGLERQLERAEGALAGLRERHREARPEEPRAQDASLAIGRGHTTHSWARFPSGIKGCSSCTGRAGGRINGSVISTPRP